MLQFVRGQLSTPPMPRVDLSGRTILVTGANSGLGLEATKILAQLKCSTIVVACRSLAKCEIAREAILQAASALHKDQATVVMLELDMCSFSSTVAFAERCKDLPRLDSAILNAGVDLLEFSLAEGYETTITVNVISTMLLAVLLVPIMRISAHRYGITPTIAVTGSAVHAFADKKELTTPAEGQILRSLSDPKITIMKGERRYFLSKLPVMLLVKHLAGILTRSAEAQPSEKPMVVINNVAPGYCKTELFRSHKASVAKSLADMIQREADIGARTLVHGGTAGEETHGQYLSECQVKKASQFVRSVEGDRTAERLWKELVVIYDQVKPGCSKLL